MEYRNYICDECGYEYFGCGGLDFWITAEGVQTVSCIECEELQDVPLGVTHHEMMAMVRGLEKQRPLTLPLAGLTFACKVEPWHTVRPWAGTPNPHWSVPGTVIAACPRCGGHMTPGDTWVIFE